VIAGDPVLGDAFGSALRYCYKKGARPGEEYSIAERDDGFIDAEDASNYFVDGATMLALDRFLLELAGARVLDFGAGPGSHALYLEAQGHSVVALDRSEGALEVAAQRGVKETFLGTAADLAARGDAFDSILMMGNNLNLLESRERAPQHLEELASLIPRGALLLGRGADPHHTRDERNFAYYDANRARGRLPGTARLRVRHRHLATPWADYLFASIDELAEIVHRSPFEIVDTRSEGVLYAAVLKKR
jgi:SAM-dependent methyltransferase